MVEKVSVNLINLFDKLLYIVTDRRAVLALLTVVFTVLAPDMLGDEEVYAEQWFEFVKAAGPIVTALLGMITVIFSWTKEKPTGLQGYKGARKVKFDAKKLPDDKLVEEVVKRYGNES